jgi:hypothetical protein
MALDTDLFEEFSQSVMIKRFKCLRHKTPFTPKTCHKGFIVQCIGQVASPAAGRFEFGADVGEFLE